MAQDLEVESAAAEKATNIDSSPFLDIYSRFGTIENMAERAAELCNNHSDGRWGLMPGLTRDGREIRDSDIESVFQEAIAGIVNVRREAFSIIRDIRIAPLTEA